MTSDTSKSETSLEPGSPYVGQPPPRGSATAAAQGLWTDADDVPHPASESMSARDDDIDFKDGEVEVEFKDIHDSHAPLPSDGDELGLLGRQIGKLRTELLLRSGSPESASLTLAVLSASAGDGRSLIAAELAKSFARLGRSTLLIDADLRRPVQHTLFGFNLGKGLVHAIVDDVLLPLNSVPSFTSLSVLTAGARKNYDPTELLSHTRFKRILNSLRGMFEFIVIDTPAFNGHPDAQVVAALAGRVLTVHRAGSSQYREARAMLRSLAVSNTAVVGGVLNHR